MAWKRGYRYAPEHELVKVQPGGGRPVALQIGVNRSDHGRTVAGIIEQALTPMCLRSIRATFKV